MIEYKKILFLILIISFYSCNQKVDWPSPTGFRAVLINNDSTSVITSKDDKVVISYHSENMVRQLYDLSIEEYDNYYSVSSLAAFSCADSIYIDCKEKVDTLVIIQYPIYEDEVFEGIFNGKKICITEYKGIMYLVR